MSDELRQVPFVEGRGGREFNDSFKRAVAEAVRRESERLIPAENHSRFYHGRTWMMKREDGSEMTSEVEGHSAEGQIGFTDLVQGRFCRTTRVHCFDGAPRERSSGEIAF